MPIDQNFKPTDLDYLSGNHHLQMMKAALPYMSVSEQRMLSTFVKVQELSRTIRLFEDEEVAVMGICSLENEPPTPENMLKAMKPYANPREQNFIDLFSIMLKTAGRPTMEQFRSMLSPEQQSRLETMQMMMQMMQQPT